MSHAPWLTDLFDRDRFNSTVIEIRKAIKKNGIDAIVVTGVSGLVLGGAVAAISDARLIIVRKPGDKRHSGYVVECSDLEYKKIAFLDDLISTGKTYRRVKRKLKEEGKAISAVILYDATTEHNKRDAKKNCEEQIIYA